MTKLEAKKLLSRPMQRKHMAVIHAHDEFLFKTKELVAAIEPAVLNQIIQHCDRMMKSGIAIDPQLSTSEAVQCVLAVFTYAGYLDALAALWNEQTETARELKK